LAKSLKLTNDNYWDASGVVYNKTSLNNVIDNLKEKVLWTGSKKINGQNNTSKDLSGMPNLSNYVGKYIRFCFNYGNNSFVRDIVLLSATDWQFIEMVRDYSGVNDAWHLLFGLYNLNSTTWKIKTVHSYVVSNSSIQVINSDSYSWYISKVSILGQ